MQARYKDPQKGDAHSVLWYRGSGVRTYCGNGADTELEKAGCFLLGSKEQSS